MNIISNTTEQIDKREAEWEAKCDEVVTNIIRVFPALKVTFRLHAPLIGSNHTMEIAGRVPYEYRFSIRIKLDDFEKQPAKAIAEAYTDKLTQCQKEKPSEFRIERK